MAWTTPRTWVTGEVVTAALLNAQIKANMDLSAPAKLTTAGDMLYATGANATARLAKGTNGNILHQASCAPAWTATPSITDLTLSGALDVNGTIDYDGTDVDMLSSGDIDLVSSANAAAAIYIAQSTGTSGTIKIHADTGTSVTEGAESINILSDVGGVGIRSTANLANAINLTADGGTTSTIQIYNDTGTAVNEGVASVQLLSDVGGIGIKSGLDAAGAIRLTADAGTSETIIIHSDLGSGAASICLTSDAGGITLTPSSAVTVSGALTVGVDDTGHDVTFFGAAAGAYMLYDQSCNLLDIRGATAAGPGHLKLTTGETTVVACDVLGRIDFQAPLEADCSADARLVAATIAAVAQGTFSNTVNATDLIFYTGHSETAAERFRFTSQNEIGIAGANYGTDGQVLTSGGAGAAVAWEDAGGISGLGSTDNVILRANGTGGATAQGSGVSITDANQVVFVDGAACAPSIANCGDLNTGIFWPANDSIAVANCNLERFRFSGSAFYVMDTANAKMDRGITLQQTTSDNEIFALKSCDVAHGITGTAETDTYLAVKKYTATQGGFEMFGLSEQATAIALHGLGTGENTGKSLTQPGTIILRAGKANGTAIQDLGSDGNLVSIHAHATGARFIFDVEGTAHADVGTATYDDYNDVELLRGFLATTCDQYKQKYQDRFGQDLMYNQQWYEDNKLIGKCSIHYETRECGRVQQRAMVNMTGLTMLHHSTIIQMNDQLTARIDGIENQLKALSEGK